MNIIVSRYRLKGEAIDGKLIIDGMIVCDTTENSIHAIKAGTYTVSAEKCQVAKRNIPVINLHKDICRDCEKCLHTAEKNLKEALKPLNAICHAIDKGIDEGVSEEEYTANAFAIEKSYTPHAPKDAMPLCPQFR